MDLRESQTYRDTVRAAQEIAQEEANNQDKVQVIYSGLDPSNPESLIVYVRARREVAPQGALLLETVSPETTP